MSPNRFLLLPLLAAGLSVQADPQPNWLQQAQQFNRDTVSKEDPAAKPHLFINGTLATGTSRPYQIQLDAQRHYTFFADCDRRCSDLDLALRLNGTLLKADNGNNAFPLFGWQATQSGYYTLTITLEQCTAPDCEYSIQVFEGRKKVF